MNPVTKVNGELPFKEPELIVLTLEEAKLVKKALAIASCPSFAYSDTYFAFFKEMEKRIKQVESK